MTDLSGKRFIIYGGGLSGRAAKKAIKRLGGKSDLFTDRDGRFIAPADRGYEGAVISPGIRPTHGIYRYCRERAIPVMGEAELGINAASATVAGVTGTNGKTTVTRLIAAMTGGVACGNIGYPVSTAAFESGGRTLVCELSSFQLYTAKIAPAVAVITNIAPDHLDWHGSYAEYCRCKCNIANGMKSGTLVLGGDITVGALAALDTGARIVRCSMSGACDGAYVSKGNIYCFGERICAVDYIRLQGEHNVKNALCAVAAAVALGADRESIIDALSSAQSDPHRNERVGFYGGKLWIDDSKGTNVSATQAAIKNTASDNVCLILGGRSKATDFSELFVALDGRVKSVVAMGEAAQAVRDCAAELAPEVKLTVVNGLTDAVRAAALSRADTVLLSPACASFDEFSSYARRGERYAQLVRSLGNSEK